LDKPNPLALVLLLTLDKPTLVLLLALDKPKPLALFLLLALDKPNPLALVLLLALDKPNPLALVLRLDSEKPDVGLDKFMVRRLSLDGLVGLQQPSASHLIRQSCISAH
jgi:hypothetical protein